MPSYTISEQETLFGERLKALRLSQNLDQMTLAARAGISVSTLKNLESGAGSSLKTMIAVLRILGREEWLATVAPIASINPLTLPRAARQRQRASRRTPSAIP